MNVTINGKDAYTEWGIVFDSSSISALMTPPPMKDYLTSKSRLSDGVKVITDQSLAKVNSRTITISFSLTAQNEDEFFARYGLFCEEIQKTGEINIKLSIQPGVVYKLHYMSCQQFTQYNNKLANFALRCMEANPKDRNEK